MGGHETQGVVAAQFPFATVLWIEGLNVLDRPKYPRIRLHKNQTNSTATITTITASEKPSIAITGCDTRPSTFHS